MAWGIVEGIARVEVQNPPALTYMSEAIALRSAKPNWESILSFSRSKLTLFYDLSEISDRYWAKISKDALKHFEIKGS